MAALLGIALLPPGATRAAPSIVDSKFELFVTEVGESIAFYAPLGFDVVRRKPDDYTTLASAGTVIALSPVPGWIPLRWLGFLRSPPIGTEIVLYSDDLEGHRTALAEAGFEPGPIERQPWGDRDFRVTDPDGYYVRISEGGAIPSDR